MNNHPNTTTQIANYVGMAFGSWQAMCTDVLGMKPGAAKIVAKLLNIAQKNRRMDVAQEMLTTFNDVPDPVHKWCMAMTLKPKSNHHKGSVQKSQD